MGNESERQSYLPDPAAIFASALSLWHACHRCVAADCRLNLSESYNGIDQFMRELMRIATQFEEWACAHIAFDELCDTWPYLLEDKFGDACLATLFPSALAEFNAMDCLRVAFYLQLPVRFNENLRLPIDVTACNPVTNSAFREFRIQTVRNSMEGGESVPFTLADEPFDDEFGAPYFGLYGVGSDDLGEHIADRKTYAEAVTLAQKLAPGIQFPLAPAFVDARSSRGRR